MSDRLTDAPLPGFVVCKPVTRGIFKLVVSIKMSPFEIDTDDIKDQIDAIYRAKYRRYAVSIIDRITSPAARAATIKLVPR